MAAYKSPNYFRHTFKMSKELKSYTVYELVEVLGNSNLLTQLIRIEPYFGKSSATNIKEYLRLRDVSNWSKCEQVTGLRPTHKEGLFYGDRQRPGVSKTLLIFQFSKDRQSLIIDVYRGFYPNHKGILQNWLLRFKLCHLYRFYSASDFGSNRAT